MNKISVGGTVLQGYGFAARRILQNLGLGWLAAVFYAVSAAYWLQQFSTTMLVSPHPGSELNDFALFDLFGLVVTTAFASAVIARALTGAALEPGGETMTAYFAVAKREWILFLSLLRLYAFVIAGLFATVFLGGLAIKMAAPAIGNMQWQGIGALSALNAAVALVAFVVTATLAVRFGFFAAPIASDEHSMARAWSMSRGNSWRLFAVALALSVPVLLMWAAAQWALIGDDFSAALTALSSPSHDSTALYRMVDSNAAIIASCWTLLLVVLNMLFAGASAPAYLTMRDNASVRAHRTEAPVLEPALAGSFAGFAPRFAREPKADAALHHEVAQEVFTARPEAGKASVETAAIEPHAADSQSSDALPIEATPEAASPQTETAADERVAAEQHHALAAVHHDDAHDTLILADEVHSGATDAPAAPEPAHVVPFPSDSDHAADHAFEHVEAALTETQPETGEVIPLLSHDGETGLSPQSAPSEAA